MRTRLRSRCLAWILPLLWVWAGGAVAQEILRPHGVRVLAYPVEIGGVAAAVEDVHGAQERPYFAPSDAAAALWEEKVREVLREVRRETAAVGDTVAWWLELTVPPEVVSWKPVPAAASKVPVATTRRPVSSPPPAVPA